METRRVRVTVSRVDVTNNQPDEQLAANRRAGADRNQRNLYINQIFKENFHWVKKGKPYDCTREIIMDFGEKYRIHYQNTAFTFNGHVALLRNGPEFSKDMKYGQDYWLGYIDAVEWWEAQRAKLRAELPLLVMTQSPQPEDGEEEEDKNEEEEREEEESGPFTRDTINFGTSQHLPIFQDTQETRGKRTMISGNGSPTGVVDLMSPSAPHGRLERNGKNRKENKKEKLPRKKINNNNSNHHHHDSSSSSSSSSSGLLGSKRTESDSSDGQLSQRATKVKRSRQQDALSTQTALPPPAPSDLAQGQRVSSLSSSSQPNMKAPSKVVTSRSPLSAFSSSLLTRPTSTAAAPGAVSSSSLSSAAAAAAAVAAAVAVSSSSSSSFNNNNNNNNTISAEMEMLEFLYSPCANSYYTEGNNGLDRVQYYLENTAKFDKQKPGDLKYLDAKDWDFISDEVHLKGVPRKKFNVLRSKLLILEE